MLQISQLISQHNTKIKILSYLYSRDAEPYTLRWLRLRLRVSVSAPAPAPALRTGAAAFEVLGVHFVGIQEAVLEELGDQHEMFFVVEVIMQSEEMALLSIAVGRDIPQQFDFVDGLIEVVLGIGGFVVLDYFVLCSYSLF